MDDLRFLKVLSQAPNWRVVGLYGADVLDSNFEGIMDPTDLPQAFWIDLESLKEWVNMNAPDVAQASGDSATLAPIGRQHPIFLGVENIESGNWVLMEYRGSSLMSWALGIGFIGVATTILLKTGS